MKIIIENFYYKGQGVKRYECNMPNVKNIEDVPEDRIVDYIKENLEELLNIQQKGDGNHD